MVSGLKVARLLRLASVALVLVYMFNTQLIHRITADQEKEIHGVSQVIESFGVPPPTLELGDVAKTNTSSLSSSGYVPATSNHVIPTKSSDLSNSMRISFILHDPNDVPYPDIFASRRDYKCNVKIRSDLPPSLAERTLLNFTTSIRTDLKIGFMGDSIAAQFSQAFDAAAIANGDLGRRWALHAVNKPEKGFKSECLTLSSLNGGGVSAFWRLYDMMSMRNKREKYICDPKHHHDLGWAEHQAAMLKGHSLGNGPEDIQKVGIFDAFVIRLTHGWLRLDQITEEAIVEEINLINQHLGAQTVIVSTLPLCNNVRTTGDWMKMAEINQMVRDISQNWESPSPGRDGIKTVLVQEFGNFTSQLIWMNAKHIGYNISMPDFSQDGWELNEADFLFNNRLSGQGRWSPSKPQVCASRNFWFDEKKIEQCVLGRISVDGSHWCQNSLGPRHSASISCLLGCVYNGKTGKDHAEVKECERQCNDQFMSLAPVNEEWIGTGTSIFSI